MLFPLLLALQATPADLRAVGVVTTRNGDRSVAVLACADHTRVVAVGEAACGGRVLEVGPTSVTLDFEGAQVVVPLAAGATAAPLRLAAPPPPPSAADAPATLNLPRAEMDRRLGAELDRILAETALRPVEGNQGLVLSRIAEGTLLTDAGLRAGDVLTEINGVTIDSIATLIGLYGQLQTQTHVQATVVRNGEPLSLALNLK